MCKTNRQDDISMYLGLYIHFNNFEKKPNYNDFGIAGVATSLIIN